MWGGLDAHQSLGKGISPCSRMRDTWQLSGCLRVINVACCQLRTSAEGQGDASSVPFRQISSRKRLVCFGELLRVVPHWPYKDLSRKSFALKGVYLPPSDCSSQHISESYIAASDAITEHQFRVKLDKTVMHKINFSDLYWVNDDEIPAHLLIFSAPYIWNKAQLHGILSNPNSFCATNKEF